MSRPNHTAVTPRGQPHWLPGVLLFTVALLLAWLVLGAGIANAGDLVVGEYSSPTTRAVNTSFEGSPSEAVMVILTANIPGEGEWNAAVKVDGKTVANMYMQQVRSGTGHESVTFLVPKAKSWEIASSHLESETFSSVQTGVTAEGGTEGKEGKEGKEGPEGKEGKEGKEGAGGGGGGSGKIDSFGPEAQSTISEVVERGEVLAWCLVGAIIASVLYLAVRDMLRMRKA